MLYSFQKFMEIMQVIKYIKRNKQKYKTASTVCEPVGSDLLFTSTPDTGSIDFSSYMLGEFFPFMSEANASIICAEFGCLQQCVTKCIKLESRMNIMEKYLVKYVAHNDEQLKRVDLTEDFAKIVQLRNV